MEDIQSSPLAIWTICEEGECGMLKNSKTERETGDICNMQTSFLES